MHGNQRNNHLWKMLYFEKGVHFFTSQLSCSYPFNQLGGEKEHLFQDNHICMLYKFRTLVYMETILLLGCCKNIDFPHE